MSLFRRRPAAIDATVHIRGDVNCDANLVIDGTITGSVTLEEGQLTIGRAGRATATLKASVIQIDGLVVGDVLAATLVVVTKTGQVQGNLIGPRIVLEPGARIIGGVDMSARTALPAATSDQ